MIFKIKLAVKGLMYNFYKFCYNIIWFIQKNYILLLIILGLILGLIGYILISNEYHKNKYQQLSNRNIYLENKIIKLEKDLLHEKKQRKIEVLLIQEKVNNLHKFVKRLYPGYDYDYNNKVKEAFENTTKINELPEDLLKIYVEEKYMKNHGLNKYQKTLKNVQWPMDEKTSYVTGKGAEFSAYRPRPYYNYKHVGLDFLSHYDNSVHNIHDSKVWRTWYSELEGWVVEIKFKYEELDGSYNWYFSRFKHLEKIYVKKGDILKKGHIIANMGNTGYSTGKHLHWELWQYNKNTRKYYPINPVQNSTWSNKVIERL